MPYYIAICDKCINGEVINEEHDIQCDTKNRIIKRNQSVRHCDEFTSIKKKELEYPRIFR